MFNSGADLGSMANSVRLLVPVPFAVLIVLIAGLLLGLDIALPYPRYSKVLRWLTLSLVTYFGVLLVVKVDWVSVATHTFVPSFVWSRTEIAALIAILGTTISPYLFFWQASEEAEEEIEHHEIGAVDRGHVEAMRTDVIAGWGRPSS